MFAAAVNGNIFAFNLRDLFAKNFMDPRTAAKVHMVTTDAMLATLIPLEFIPTTYGGSSTYEFDPSAYQVAT